MAYARIEYDLTDMPYRRVKRGMNWMCLLTGEPGSGKSYAALSTLHRLATRLKIPFDGWNICFDANVLKNRLEDIKPGTPLLFDEAGASFSARRSMSSGNVAMSTVLQTFRFLNIPLIWTVPHIAQIDINARRLMHGHMVALSWNKSTELTRVKYYNVVKPFAGDSDGDILRKYPRVKTEYGMAKIKNFYIQKPPDDLVEIYEDMARENKNFMIKHGKPAPDRYREPAELAEPDNPDVKPAKKYKILQTKKMLKEHLTPIADGGLGYTYQSLADMLGVHRATVARWVKYHGLVHKR